VSLDLIQHEDNDHALAPVSKKKNDALAWAARLSVSEAPKIKMMIMDNEMYLLHKGYSLRSI
jgi:hypothetical protein